MRMIVSAVCFTGTALFLQGCGEAETEEAGVPVPVPVPIPVPEPISTCLAPHLNFVSQSISGTVEMSNQMGDADPMHPVMAEHLIAPFNEKIDFEQFNLQASSSSSQVVLIEGKNVTITANVIEILDMGEKHVIVYTEVNNPLTGNMTKTCVIQALPDMIPDAAALAAIFKAQVDAAECAGTHGTYDTWKISKSYDGPVPNIPDLPIPPNMADGITVKGSVRMEITMTQDSLVHSASEAAIFDVMQASTPLISGETSTDLSVSSAEAGGPSAADLDPTQFDVECTPAPGEFNANTFFASSPPGVFRKHVRATLQEALRAQHTAIAV